MGTIALFITLLAMAALAFVAYRHHEAAEPVHAPALRVPSDEPRRQDPPPSTAVAPARVSYASAPAVPVELADIEWDGPFEPAPIAARPAAGRAAKPGSGPAPKSAASANVGPKPGAEPKLSGVDDALRRKIRDRYIAARFPCTAQSSADLARVERVIKAARLFFEEEHADRAMELLALAVEQNPGDESLRLAQLEIAFLMRDGDAFLPLALAFRREHPQSAAWAEISRLGQALAPDEPAYGAPGDKPAHRHYGPWPETPNWIQASWDLTSEVLATELHQALKRRGAAAAERSLPRAA